MSLRTIQSQLSQKHENSDQHPALMRKEILIHATTWMNFKDIILNEMSQSQHTV